MLLRILTDNPGSPFTQNFDTKFVSTVKSLLRDGKDQSVQQIMRETLDYFEVEKASGDDKLGPLIQMWRKEKSKSARFNQGPAVSHGMSDVYVPQETHSSQYPQYAGGQHHQSRQSRPPRGLPSQEELAARIEEAKTTARLLIQTVQSTPQSELVGNELVKEFSERARSAHKSIQAYMNCENPSPDEDTMLTLIETNEQLNVAMSKHQRSILQARKAAGMSPSPQPTPGQERNSYISPHTQGQNVYSNFSGQTPPQAQQANHGPYSSSPPRQRNGFSPVSPPSRAPTLPIRHREEENFAPPPGPPPNRMSTQAQPQPPQRGQTYEYENAYSSPPRAPKPMESPPTSQPLASPTSAAAYGVAENPFADDSEAAEPPQQKSYSMLDRASHHITTSSPTKENNTSNGDLDTRPGTYQPTQSYIHRQDSSLNTLTMHGGSPPPVEGQRT